MPQENTSLEPTKENSLKCKRCGRKLKNPESMELGFGVVCYQKYLNRKKLIPLFKMRKQEEAEEMNERVTKELVAKTKKIDELSGKVKSLRNDNKVKDAVIADLVDMLPADLAGDRTKLVKQLIKEAKKRVSRC